MRTMRFYAVGDIAELYRWFAAEAAPTSPIWGTLCSWIAEEPEALALLDRFPGAKRQPNLFLGAVRYLDGPSVPGAGFLEWMRERWDEIETIVLTHATQTNEPGRCAVFLPFLTALPQPLALIEVSMSAGLCLFPDRYAYRYRSGSHEVLAGPPSSRWWFDCEVPPRDLPRLAPIDVVWRAGIDLNPLDPRSPEDARWVRGDLVEELPTLVGQAPPGASVVVFHTAVLAYLEQAARERFVETVSSLDITWISNEGFDVTPGVAGLLPEAERCGSEFVLAVDGRPVARTQPHGRAMRWL